jgi:hypothetical protein
MGELTDTERRAINAYGSNLVKMNAIPDVQVLFDAFSLIELHNMAALAKSNNVNTTWVLQQIRLRSI